MINFRYNRCEFRVACVSEGEETVLETASKVRYEWDTVADYGSSKVR